MDTFIWRVLTTSTAKVKGSISRTQFGDGYSQTSPKGINPVIRQYEINVVGTGTEILPIFQFLEDHFGKKFKWKPFLAAEGVYQCDEYDLTPQSGNLYTLSATFTQTYKAASDGT